MADVALSGQCRVDRWRCPTDGRGPGKELARLPQSSRGVENVQNLVEVGELFLLLHGELGGGGRHLASVGGNGRCPPARREDVAGSGGQCSAHGRRREHDASGLQVGDGWSMTERRILTCSVIIPIDICTKAIDIIRGVFSWISTQRLMRSELMRRLWLVAIVFC